MSKILGLPIDIPADIHQKAIDIDNFFTKNGIKDWEFLSIQSRKTNDSKTILLSMKEYELILKALNSCHYSGEYYYNTDFVESYTFDKKLVERAKKILNVP